MASLIKPVVLNDIVVKGKRIGDYFFDEETNTIFYDLPYPFPCKFAVVDLKRVYVTPMMLKLPYFLKYHNIDHLCQQLTQIQCVEEGCLLLHGAAWQKFWVGYLAVGFPNSGKTSRVIMEAEVRKALFCSDENIIFDVSTKIATPVPRKTSLNPWIAKEVNYPLSLRQKIDFLFAKLRAKLLPIFEPNIWVDLPYPRHSIKINKIIYLSPGKGKSLRLLTDNEFPFFTNPVIQTYAYAAGFDLDMVYTKYRRLFDVISIDP